MINVDRIINIIRQLREDSPTMNVGTSGFTNYSNSKGPVAGYDKPMDFVRKDSQALDFRRKLPKKLPIEYQNLFRRKNRV